MSREGGLEAKRAAGGGASSQGPKTPSAPKTALVPAKVAAVHDWNIEVTFGYKVCVYVFGGGGGVCVCV